MSYGIPYQPYQRTPPPKSKRSLVLLVLTGLAALAMLLVTPVARFFLIRVYDEFDLELPGLTVLVVRLFPELIALPIIVALGIIEFVVPSGLARNICNLAFLGVILLVAMIILLGFGLSLFKLSQSM